MTSHLQLFGTPVLHWNGTPVRLDRRKAMALLSYLAVTRRCHHRETLATLLWPESESESAHAGLRNLLWMLRKTPIAEHIQSDRSTVTLLENETLSIDVNRFRDLVRDCPTAAHGMDVVCAQCEPRLAEAMCLRTGSFMHGYAAANSTQFDEWQVAEGAALNREASETLSRMIEYYLSIEDWCATARYARQWIKIDALNELGYRALMKALLAQGKRSEALQVYDECGRILGEELGLTPEDTTSDLASAIRNTQVAVSIGGRVRVSRLPQAAIPLIGRSVPAQRVEVLLLDESTRFVSLVGLGGVGKTSLALHVGRHIEGHFAEGAAYVPLDSGSSGSSIASAVIRALNLTSIGGTRPTLDACLADVLQDQHVLLILDGVEGLVPQVSAFAQALETAPGVRILATSRVEIGIAGEIIVPLQGLEVPDEDADPRTIADCAAVRLLHLVAERQGAHSSPDAAELSGMARLAVQLEGSPLGLEMAAGWRSILSWDAIADRISDGLEFLVHRRKDVAPRHRTMAVVFEQSWKLLPTDARAALRRLSVFRGGFTIQAAERVTKSDPTSLAVLVNRHLLTRIGSDCYRMHALLRQFASARMETTEAEQLLLRHLDYYTSAVGEWFEKLKGPDQHQTFRCMENEIENVRLAFQNAASQGASQQLRDLCEGLFCYHDMRTLLTEGEATFTRALESYRQCPDREEIVDAFLTIAAGYFAVWDHPDAAHHLKGDGLKLLSGMELDDRLHAMANILYAGVSFGQERDENSERLMQSIDFYRAQADLWGEGSALGTWATVETFHDSMRVEQLAQESLRLHRGLKDQWGESIALFLLARAAELQGNLKLSLARYQDAQRLTEPFTRDGFGVISTILGQARVELRLGHGETSRQLAEEALRLGRKTGYGFQIGRALLELARATRSIGESACAEDNLEEAFRLLNHQRWSSLQAACAVQLLELALDESDEISAERWLREASVLKPNDPSITQLSARLEQMKSQA